MYVTIMQLVLTIILSFFGITPAWCGSCGEMYPAEKLETHVFADEYEHGLEYYELDICPICVDYWTR